MLVNTLLTLILVTQIHGYVPTNGCDDTWECSDDCGPDPCDVRPVRPAPAPAPMAGALPAAPPELKLEDTSGKLGNNSSLFTLDTARVLPEGHSSAALKFYIIPEYRLGLGSGMEVSVTAVPIGGMLSMKQSLIDTDTLAVSAAGGLMVLGGEVGVMYAGLKSQFDLGRLSLYGEAYGLAAGMEDEFEFASTFLHVGATLRMSDSFSIMGEGWSLTEDDDGDWFGLVGVRFSHPMANGKIYYWDVFMPVIRDNQEFESIPLIGMNFGVTY